MNSVTPFAQGVLRDLQRRRLLPVAGLLLVLLVALPLFMLKDSEPVPPIPAAPASAPASAPAADGLPSPEQALGAAGKPLVSLAVLDSSSNLDSFESKNPFKPLNQVSTGGAGSGPPSSPGGDSGFTVSAGATSGGGSSGGGKTGKAPSFGGGTPTSGGSPTPSPGASPAPSPPKKPDAPSRRKPPAKERKLTYAVHATLTGPSRTVRYRSIYKLTMLPTQAAPVLIFLGVDLSGKKAVFLVDSSLKVTDGEGTCTPSVDSCSTVSLEPGQLMRFSNGQGGSYTLQIAGIREVPIPKAESAAARRLERTKAQTPTGPVRRFVPPIITDMFTAGR